MTLRMNFKDILITTETHGMRGFRLIKSGNADLIILDIVLPGMDGEKICKELRKMNKYSKTPILAFTALDLDFKEIDLLNAGFDFCISKSTDLFNLVKIIKTYLHQDKSISK